MAAPVEGEDAPGRRIVENGVGIIAYFYFAAGRQRLHVKNTDRAFAPVADKSTAQFRRQCDAMNARGIGDVTYAFA